MATVWPQDIRSYIIDLKEQEQRTRKPSNASSNSASSSMSATSSDSETSEENIFNRDNPYILAIIKRFDFDSKLARMSVIVKNKKENKYKLFTKGAPENIRRLCLQESVPSTFHDILKMYTEKGLRVIALAYKELIDTDYYKISQMKRESVEFDLKFLGLVLLNNELKKETIPSINSLHKAKIKTIMATGDNPLTAISVAREWGIVDSSLPVYLGELVTLKNGDKKLTWTNVDKFDSQLDPMTLTPLEAEEEEFKRNTIVFNENSSFTLLK